MSQPEKASSAIDMFPESLPTAVSDPPRTIGGRPIRIRMVFELIKSNPGITSNSIVAMTQLSPRQVRAIESKLVLGGVVRRYRIGSTVYLRAIAEYKPLRVAPSIKESRWGAFKRWIVGLFK